MRLELYFSDARPSFLEKVIFENEFEGNLLTSVRAKCGTRSLGAFSWSPAVRALSSLAIQSKLSHLGAKGPPTLEGGVKTLAASFDYALSKRPNWLMDMFGVDENGVSVANRIFRRRNAERKRGGNVAIWIAPAGLPHDRIQLFWMGKELKDKETIRILQDHVIGGSQVAFENGYCPSVVKSRRFEASFQGPLSNPNGMKSRLTSKSFAAAYEDSLVRALRSFDVFSPIQASKIVTDSFQNDRFQRLLSKRWREDFTVDLWKLSKKGIEFSGEPSPSLRDSNLRVGVYPGSCVSMTLIHRLNEKYKLRLKPKYNFMAAGSIVKHVRGGDELDVLFLPLAVSHHLLGKRAGNYRAVGVLPGSAAPVVRPSHAGQFIRQEDVVFEFTCEGISSGHWTLDHLFQKAGSDVTKARTTHVSMVDQLQRMKSCDENVRYISWFPFSYWAQTDLGAAIAPHTDVIPTFQLMFAHESLPAKLIEELCSCMYSCLAELSHFAPIRGRAVHEVLSDQEYVTTIAQMGGSLVSL